MENYAFNIVWQNKWVRFFSIFIIFRTFPKISIESYIYTIRNIYVSVNYIYIWDQIQRINVNRPIFMKLHFHVCICKLILKMGQKMMNYLTKPN